MVKRPESVLDKSLKLIVKTSFFVFLAVILSKLFTYIYRIIIARYFGPEGYGLFSLGLNIFILVSSFASLGLAEGIIRFVSFYHGRKQLNQIRYIYRFSLIVSFISSLIAAFMLFVLADFISISIFHDSGLIIYLKLFSFTIPLYIISNLFISLIRAYEKIKEYAFIQNILQNLIKIVSILVLIFLGVNSGSVPISYSLAVISVLIVSFLFSKYSLPEIFIKSSLKEKQKKEIRTSLIAYSLPLILLSLVNAVLNWIDSFSIGYYKSVVEVGIYNAAIPIVNFLLIAPEVVMQLFFPLINKEYSKNNIELIKRLSQQVGKWIFIINLPIFLLLIIFPGAAINILFGQEYLAGENVLRVLAVSALFSSVVMISSYLISMIGRTYLILINTAVLSVINFILNIFLVPIYGITGAAVSTAACSIVLNLLFLIQAKKYTSIIPLKKKMILISLVSIIPFILLSLLKRFIPLSFFSLAFIGLVFFLSYFALIWLTKCFDEKDLMILRALKAKILPKA